MWFRLNYLQVDLGLRGLSRCFMILRQQFLQLNFGLSDMRARTDSQRQDWHLRPIRDCPGWQVQKADQDGTAGA